jgi:hypothetical protein
MNTWAFYEHFRCAGDGPKNGSERRPGPRRAEGCRKYGHKTVASSRRYGHKTVASSRRYGCKTAVGSVGLATREGRSRKVAEG